MTVIHEKIEAGADGMQGWCRVDGTRVVLYVLPGSPEAAPAADTLHKAEAIVTALSKLLEAEDAHYGERLSVYLAAATPAESASPLSLATDRADRGQTAAGQDEEPAPCVLSGYGSPALFARAITGHLLRQWFGAEVMSAPGF